MVNVSNTGTMVQHCWLLNACRRGCMPIPGRHIPKIRILTQCLLQPASHRGMWSRCTTRRGRSRTSIRLLTPVGHSTPLSSPTKCPTSVIIPNPAFAPSPSLEWDVSEVGLVGVMREQLSGIERLRAGGEERRKPSATNPNYLEEQELLWWTLKNLHWPALGAWVDYLPAHSLMWRLSWARISELNKLGREKKSSPSPHCYLVMGLVPVTVCDVLVHVCL
jgi:hypothetical protein